MAMPTYTISANDTRISSFPSGVWNAHNDGSLATHRAGASALYMFAGTSVQVFGSFVKTQNNMHVPPNASGSLDDSACTPVSVSGSNSGGSNELLFQCPMVINGSHTLNITKEDSMHMLVLNSFVITVSNASSSPTPTTVLTSGNPSQASSSSSSITSTPEASILPSHRVNVGGVVGGIIALVALGAMSVYAIYVWRRRRQRNASRLATPFVTPVVSARPSPSYLAGPATLSSTPYLFTTGEKYVQASDRMPPFAPRPSQGQTKRGSTEKPQRRSEDSLPPVEYGYGRGL